MSVSVLIRDGRKSRGWGQEALARAANVSTTTVVRTERGTAPLAVTLFAMTEALGIDPALVRDAVLADDGARQDPRLRQPEPTQR